MFVFLGYAVGAAVTVAIRRQMIPKPFVWREKREYDHGFGMTWFSTHVSVWRPVRARKGA